MAGTAKFEVVVVDKPVARHNRNFSNLCYANPVFYYHFSNLYYSSLFPQPLLLFFFLYPVPLMPITNRSQSVH